MARRRSVSLLSLFLLMTALSLSGCMGFGKRDDATDPYSASIARKAATSMEIQSSLARTSGEVTFLRLTSLFPSASINLNDFTLLGATGLNRAFSEMQRPYSSLAQVALRNRATSYCRSEIESGDRSKVFSSAVLVSGETLPSDPATLAAFTAARNIWLDLYTASSPEVKELAALYTSTNAVSTEKSPDLEAKRAVCIAALLAPQFWIGNAAPTDVIRRIALEVGRRLPTFTELKNFADHKLTAGDFVTQIQKEPGYLQALHGWNEEWLGLRTFLDAPSMDMRGGSLMGDATGTSLLNAVGFVQTGDTMGANNWFPSGQKCDGLADQTFDPDTNYMVWEQDTSTATPKTFFLGAYVRPEHVAEFKANYLGSPEMRATYPDLTVDTLYNLLCLAPGDTTSNPPNTSPDWVMCNGLMPMSSDDLTAYQAAETDFNQQIQKYTLLAQNTSSTAASQAANLLMAGTTLPKYRTSMEARRYSSNYYRTYLTDVTNLRTTAANLDFSPVGGLAYFNSVQKISQIPSANNYAHLHRRLRRFAPSGEQNGKSTVQLWWSGQSVKVCNDIDHFAATCFYRPTQLPRSTNPLVLGEWSAASASLGRSEANYIADSWMHPSILKDFRCGPPDYPSIVAGLADDIAYKKGTVGVTNTRAVVNTVSAPANTPESDAMVAVSKDFHAEPYNLINYVVMNDLDFGEILTANYTCGGPGLEKLYKSQGYYLPTDISGLDTIGSGAHCGMDPNDNKRIFTVKTAIPINLIKGSISTAQQGTLPVQVSANSIQPKVMSGVLTMPAFLGPVSPKMRTIASRYFTRLMCGDPNLFEPDSAQKALHSQFISQSAIHKGHLRDECIQCHINLDPLASALSANFVMHEGEVGPNGDGTGELVPYNSNQSTYFGVRGGGPKSAGALLGHPVTGVREAGQILSQSTEFNRCVVQKAFENLFGRQIGFSDAPFVNDMTSKFQSHHKYNKLIHDMVESPSYQRRN